MVAPTLDAWPLTLATLSASLFGSVSLARTLPVAEMMLSSETAAVSGLATGDALGGGSLAPPMLTVRVEEDVPPRPSLTA